MTTKFFAGSIRVKPGAYSTVDTNRSVHSGTEATKIIAIIGECDGGEPGVVQYFTSASAAKRVLRSGDLLTAAMLAWAPSTNLPGASILACVRANPATQGSHTLLADLDAPAITLTAKDYGIHDYKVKVSVEGSLATVSLTDGETLEVSGELATNDAIVAWINANSRICTAEKVAETQVIATVDWVSFTNVGTNPTPVATDWQNAIDALTAENINAIVPLTSDATIHAYVKGHVGEASINRRERRAFVGHASDETVADILNRASNLSDHRVCLVSPGIKTNVSGTVETLAPMFFAALVAGLWAGRGNSAEPLTFDYVNVLGLDTIYTEEEIEELLQGGVLIAEQVTGRGVRIVQALTTYNLDTAPILRELSISNLLDAMSITLRETLEDRFVGKSPSTSSTTSVHTATISLLNEFTRNGWLVGDDVNPAYKNVSVYRDGTAHIIEWEPSIAEPNNYIFITSHI